MSLKIDLGCGATARPGMIGVDVNSALNPDVVHDLNVFPYPFADSVADEIYLDNVLEHLVDVVATMEEIHRVGRPGAVVRIDVPYFRSRWAAIDPTHLHSFTVSSFAYFDPADAFSDRYGYSGVRFGIEKRRFNDRWPRRGLRGTVTAWANRRPEAYEVHLSHLYPLDELTFWLRIQKDE